MLAPSTWMLIGLALLLALLAAIALVPVLSRPTTLFSTAPDGTKIAYGSRILYDSSIDPLPGQDPDAWYYRIHMMGADGSDDRIVETSTTARSEGWPEWSPDGTRYVSRVEPGTDRSLEYLVISSVDGTSDPVTTEPFAGGYDGWVWSPDGSSIMVWGADSELSLIDATTGAVARLALTLGRTADWQPMPA